MLADDSRISVLFVDHTSQPSGGELALLNLLRASGDWLDPYVVLFDDGPIASQLELDGVPVTVLEGGAGVAKASRNRAVSIRTMVEVLRVSVNLFFAIRRTPARVVYCNSIKSFLVAAPVARVLRRRVVWHCRDRIASDYMRPRSVKLVRFLARVLPHLIIANSAATATTVGVGAVSVIPSPIDPKFFDRPPKRRFAGRSVDLVLVGRIASWKGQHVAIDALRLLPPEVSLVIVGDALFGEQAYKRELTRMVDDLGLGARVCFAGFRDDVPDVLDRADALLHTSVLPEPFGQVVVQGLAAGTPVVSVRLGGPAEYLHDGRDAVLVEPDDPRALAGAIRRLSGDPELAESLAREGLHTAEQFRPSIASEQTRCALTELARR